MKKEVIVAVSGYFDPIHVGHLEYLKLAKNLGDKLIVIINNNLQAELKKGEFFMHEKDRMEIVAALRSVDEVFLSVDTDGSVCKSLEIIKPDIFANGGDRSLDEIPETAVMKKYNIKDMVKSDVIFCATGVTDGDLVNGIKDLGDSFESETFLLHKSANTNKIVKNKIKK